MKVLMKNTPFLTADINMFKDLFNKYKTDEDKSIIRKSMVDFYSEKVISREKLSKEVDEFLNRNNIN